MDVVALLPIDTSNTLQQESLGQGKPHTTSGTGHLQGGRVFPKIPSSGWQVHDKREHNRPDCPNIIVRIQIPTGGSWPMWRERLGRSPVLCMRKLMMKRHRCQLS